MIDQCMISDSRKMKHKRKNWIT